jgi:hypothetical protein
MRLKSFPREVWPLLFTLLAFGVWYFGKLVGLHGTWNGVLGGVLFGVGIWLTVRNQIYRTVDTRYDEDARQFIREAAQSNLPICQRRRPNQERCKRTVARGQKFCWQHAHGLLAAWRSLTRNQTVVFLMAVVGVVGVVATFWFGFHPFVSKTPTANSAYHELPTTKAEQTEKQSELPILAQTSQEQATAPKNLPTTEVRTHLVFDGNIRFPQDVIGASHNESPERNFHVGEQLFFNYFIKALGPNPIQVFANSRWIYLEPDVKDETQQKVVKDFRQRVAREWKAQPKFAKTLPPPVRQSPSSACSKTNGPDSPAPRSGERGGTVRTLVFLPCWS